MPLFDDYIQKLQERKSKNRIAKKFQLIGLKIAELLEDKEHKSLYIKLAKERDEQELLSLAERIAQMKNIEKKGAYFMKILFKNQTTKNNKNKVVKNNNAKTIKKNIGNKQ